ncbi:hypothetical protein QE152_g5048 [Popillia japonica]|uniref:CCHC-type domain-containing protein n=1 Tax=Popillia japonica TaxID=7064 RepID=A0AAW1MRR1_POPJA
MNQEKLQKEGADLKNQETSRKRHCEGKDAEVDDALSSCWFLFVTVLLFLPLKPGLKPGDDIDKIKVLSQSEPTQTTNNTQSRRFPPLPSRPQRPQKPTTVLKAPIPLVLVKISKDQKAIYHLDKVVSLEVSVETLKSRPTIGQCYRCQKFGHAQSRCTATRRCAAFAGDHEPGACERPKQVPATCANCGEEHSANYRGCARYPKSTLRTTRPTDSPADTTRARSRASHGFSLSS